MENIYSYNIAASIDTLRSGFNSGKVPDALLEPLQSLLPRLSGAAAASPTSVYLFSSDEHAEFRNLFAYSLAAALKQHVPSTLLVDCGFLDVGLGGVVPQKDALGFLDLLLYGSSLGVITQETSGGVHVVGAGSFPVTKKMPFVVKAFDEAARRLLAHSRCTIFCGPLYDDDGALHPLIGAVDVPILVRTVATGAGVVDPVEETIAAECDKALLSVRITPRDAAAVQPAAGEPAFGPERPAAASGAEGFEEIAPRSGAKAGGEGFEEIAPAPGRAERGEEAGPAAAPPPAAPPPASGAEGPRPVIQPEPPSEVDFDEEEGRQTYPERRASSLIPKVATGALALIVIAFLTWWFTTERGGGVEVAGPAGTGQTHGASAPPTVSPGAAGAGDTTATAGTEAPETGSAVSETAQTGSGGTGAPSPAAGSAETGAPPPAVATAGAEARSDTTRPAIDPDNILVLDDLYAAWNGEYFIHISSFRQSTKARTEVARLRARGFPAFIVFVNLGAKGSWYRVYAGPLETRDDAREMKKLLDATPGVSFTRITQVSR